MIYFIVKYTRMINEENDGRKKPKWQPYTQWGCLYETLEEAEDFAAMCQYDCQEVEIFQAPFTLVKQLETAK